MKRYYNGEAQYIGNCTHLGKRALERMMDGAIKIIELVETSFTSNEPLVVNVDEGDDGEKVQVYIG